MNRNSVPRTFLLFLYQVLLISKECTCAELDAQSHDETRWTVKTNSGPVQGEAKIILDGNEVYVFSGIPFAEPPVGELRFKPPQPVKPWTDVLRATEKPLPCYQTRKQASPFRTRYEMKPITRPWSEDCLNLNVWVPKPQIGNASVLVVLHPGMFEYGSNNDPDGSILTARSKDIVVSVNYRLGAFGFLNLGNTDVPGNLGLLDQQLALKWIHENAHHFGGLQKNIVLLGSGNAGAASAGYHLLSTASFPYFASAVLVSGSPLCPWAFQDREGSILNSKLLSNRLGCRNNNSEDELDCLRHAHPEDIVDQSTVHLPTVDGSFITESPLEALKSGHFKKTHLILASSKDEGSLPLRFLNEDVIDDPERGLDLEKFRKVVKRIVPTLGNAGMSAVEDFYFEKCNPDSNLNLWDAAVRVYSDVLINCCVNQFLHLFVVNGGQGFQGISDFKKASNPSWVGAWHGEDAEYFFGLPLGHDSYTPEEKKFAEHFLHFASMFAGQTVTELQRGLPPYSEEHKNYILWNKQGRHSFAHYRDDQCKLWNEIIPRIRDSQKTCQPS